MDQYKPPNFLLKRYPNWDDRFDLREQFEEILLHINRNLQTLKALEQDDKIKTLIQEIESFRVYPWKAADRDEFFYKKLIEFDRRTFSLLIKK
jgi:hypothetical protein